MDINEILNYADGDPIHFSNAIAKILFKTLRLSDVEKPEENDIFYLEKLHEFFTEMHFKKKTTSQGNE